MKPDFLTPPTYVNDGSNLLEMMKDESNFRHALDIEDVKLQKAFSTPEFRTGRSKEQHAGLMYELNMQKILREYLPRWEKNSVYVANPYFTFYDGGLQKRRSCEMDGVWTLPSRLRIYLIEFKLRYYPQAKEKTRFLYEPVLKKFISSYTEEGQEPWKLSSFVITKVLDPSLAPDLDLKHGGSTLTFETLEEASLAPPGSFGVLEWPANSLTPLELKSP